MRPRSPIIALFLLAVFGLGGIGAPMVHMVRTSSTTSAVLKAHGLHSRGDPLMQSLPYAIKSDQGSMERVREGFLGFSKYYRQQDSQWP